MPALLERPKMTRVMYQALKRHIVKERERKKQEQEQGARLERIRKETANRKKREEEASLTLEQTKEQIVQLEAKLKNHKQEKHELFSQLKLVLQQEEDARRRASIREKSELMSLQQPYTHQIPGHHAMLLQSVPSHPTMYKPAQQPPPPVQQPSSTGTKRPRSPSPAPNPIYPTYDTKYPSSYTATKQTTPQAPRHDYKSSSYPSGQSSHGSYPSQSAQAYPAVTQSGYTIGQSPARKFTPGSHSAFTNYPAHFAQHQKLIPDVAQGYQLRMTQPASYMAGSVTASPQQSTQKSAYTDDKYQSHSRGVASSSLPRQPSSHLSSTVPPQSKTGGNGYGAPRGPIPTSTSSRGHYSNTQQPNSRYY